MVAISMKGRVFCITAPKESKTTKQKANLGSTTSRAPARLTLINESSSPKFGNEVSFRGRSRNLFVVFGWELINTAISRIINEATLDRIVLDHLERQLERGLIWLVMPSRARFVCRFVCNCRFSTSHLQPLPNPFLLLSIKHYLSISLVAPMTIEIALLSRSFLASKCVPNQMAQTSPRWSVAVLLHIPG
ncbi:hypothetical protein BJX66DRAFT_120221 [Aspergillus keveii]|uniref:Uncharacterized protein n=1 Tax=Aspergillus keveii TaxID=714993 RepID=A0ABR4FKN5_9EURO